MTDSTTGTKRDKDWILSIDALHAQGNLAKAYSLLSTAYNQKDPSHDDHDVELLWRYARGCFNQQETMRVLDKNNRKTDKAKEEALIRQGLQLANDAIQIDQHHYGGHKWKAILLSELGNYTPLTEKIQNSFVIRQELDLALTLYPAQQDSITLFAIGKWCQTVSSVGWMQRQMASALFAKPPHATHEEALGYFQRAYDICPTKRCAFAMGECYYELNEMLKCQQWMQTCLDCPSSTSSASTSAVDEDFDTKAKSFL
jgi:tetratricopeptide (TPR) repeat protein